MIISVRDWTSFVQGRGRGGGGLKSLARIFISIACTKIKWFCPNISWYVCPIFAIWQILGGLQPPPPPPPASRAVRLCASLYIFPNFKENSFELFYTFVSNVQVMRSIVLEMRMSFRDWSTATLQFVFQVPTRRGWSRLWRTWPRCHGAEDHQG